MKRDVFIEIIKDFKERSLPELVERETILKRPTVKKTISVIGPRRAGKTYFIYNIIKDLLSQGIPKERMIYINLEDDRLLPLEVQDMDLFLRTFFEIHPDNKNEDIHLFLDEVQNVDDWETFVRRIMDTYNIQVYITGSSSKLLSREIATSLRGRSLSYTILPFSFQESLKAEELEIGKFLSSSKKEKIHSTLSNFLKFGSFPEIALEKDNNLKHKIIKEYIEVMLLQDIIERHNIKNTRLLKILFNGIISSTSSTFSIHKFFKFLRSQGMKISKNALYQYVQYLEDAYAIILLRRFSFSLRKVEQSLPKVYPIDPGFILTHSTRFSRDLGKTMENVVAVELFRRKFERPDQEIYYWKGQNMKEVDFVIKEDLKITRLIQVCYDIDDFNTYEREIDPLLKSSEVLKCDDLCVITWDKDEIIEVKGKKIEYIPLWKWLINH